MDKGTDQVINLNIMNKHLCNAHIQGQVTMATKIPERYSKG